MDFLLLLSSCYFCYKFSYYIYAYRCYRVYILSISLFIFYI
nr:MAG TPA: hypothetical protein [Caudoviricetes sp.]